MKVDHKVSSAALHVLGLKKKNPKEILKQQINKRRNAGRQRRQEKQDELAGAEAIYALEVKTHTGEINVTQVRVVQGNQRKRTGGKSDGKKMERNFPVKRESLEE